VLVSVGGVKVSSSKHAVKLIKQSTSDRLSLRIERSSSLKWLAPHTEFKVEEDIVSTKVSGEATPRGCIY
jgi:hypothetical protein